MKKIILNIFLSALAPSKWGILALVYCLAISACELEEPYGGLNNNEGVIEFVARPVGFNNQTVETKAAASGDIETKIYSCYFLVFDTTPTTGGGNLVYCSDNLISGTDPVTSIPTQKINVDKKTVKKVKACFIVNVPKNFIYNSTNNTPLINNLAALNDAELGPDHFNYATHSADVPMGTPQMSINGVSNIKCIPAFGLTPTDINLEGGNTTPVSINIKRLFAKVSVELKMAIANPGIGQIMPSTVNYKLSNYLLHYIPKKVRLVESDNESKWVKDKNSFAGIDASPLSSGTIDMTAVNNDPTSSIQFEFYVPEYYLEPTAVTNNPQNKPKNFDNKKYPIYLELVGTLNRSLVDNTELKYKIYLGGDAHSDFSLSRNYHYKNSLIIYGLDKNDQGEGENLDWRVTTSLVNNPVAQHGQSANCYVVGKTGEYTIPAYKGAYTSLTSAPLCLAGKTYVETRVNVAFNKSQTTGIDQITFDANPTYDPTTNTISFSIAKLDLSILGSLDYVPNGNFVLELQYKETKGGSWITEWSWHFWCLNAVKILGTGWGQIGEQDIPDSDDPMHDRNLGVVSGTPKGAQIGFYYKYGEHTPYVDTNNDDVYEKIGGGNLGTSSWAPINNVKSPTDPCPPGYRVPSSSLWASMGSKSTVYNAYLYSGDDNALNGNEDIYYPYSEYLVDVGGTLHESEKNQLSDYKYTKQTDVWAVTTTYNLRIRYREKYSIIRGVLWATDYAIDYYTRHNQIADEKILEYKKKNQDWNKATSVNLEAVKDIWLIGDALNDAANSLIEGISVSDVSALNNTEPKENYYAAQVRCVTE